MNLQPFSLKNRELESENITEGPKTQINEEI